MDLKRPKRTVIHRGSAWSNEEHNMLYQFWRQNIDKIDLPGRTEDKLKNKIYCQMQEQFVKQGFRRSIKQIRKKIQNLKREAAKFNHIQPEQIDDENVRLRVKAVKDILALNEPDRLPATFQPMEQDNVNGANLANALFTSNGSTELWANELHHSTAAQNDQPSDTSTPVEQFRKEIIKVTETLNNAITKNDYKIYVELCEPNLTCFEPEAFGNLVEGLEFHKFYFDSNAFAVFSGEINVSIVNPKVYQIGKEAACIAYVRILQGIRKDSGVSESIQSEETRLWRKSQDKWRCFHFHRSQNYKQK